MGTTPRHLPRNTTVEVASRTLHGRFLMRPSPTAKRIIDSTMARAQERFGMEIHDYFFASNHFHIALTPSDQQQLSGFMCYLKSTLARKLARLHGWSEKFWARRYSKTNISSEPEAQWARQIYLLSQGAKENLVYSRDDWPGASATAAFRDGSLTVQTQWVDTAGMRRAKAQGEKVRERDFTTTVAVFLTPLPAFAEMDKQAYCDRVCAQLDDIRAQTIARHRSQGTKPLGELAIRSQRPTQKPKKPLEKTPLRRTFAYRSQVREEMNAVFNAFLRAYRRAANALKRGVSDVAFPAGCFPPGLPFVPHPVS